MRRNGFSLPCRPRCRCRCRCFASHCISGAFPLLSHCLPLRTCRTSLSFGPIGPNSTGEFFSALVASLQKIKRFFQNSQIRNCPCLSKQPTFANPAIATFPGVTFLKDWDGFPMRRRSFCRSLYKSDTKMCKSRNRKIECS